MTRPLVFLGLFPPLALLVYIVADQLLRDGLPGFGMVAGLVVFAYVLAIIPASLTAGVDWAFSNRPLYARLIATMSAAAISMELVARYMGQPYFDLPAALAGAIPAAACSWLSEKS